MTPMHLTEFQHRLRSLGASPATDHAISTIRASQLAFFEFYSGEQAGSYPPEGREALADSLELCVSICNDMPDPIIQQGVQRIGMYQMLLSKFFESNDFSRMARALPAARMSFRDRVHELSQRKQSHAD
ncbi:MAG: hypothetical protein H8E37_06565 [Planctomycetes bacterium]|nr:hypothetical protein [Planctomycetota bacterium]